MHDRLRTEEFWRWLCEGEACPDEPCSFEVPLPMTGVNGLKALVNEAYGVTLVDLQTAQELGWVDDVQWHPHCLRVDESLRIAQLQPDLDAQSVAALLLTPFTVATTLEEAERLVTVGASAWAHLKLPGEPVIARDFCDQSVEWYRSDGAWWLREDPTRSSGTLYTLRVEANVGFPRWLSAL